jgi:hypothetical protein
MTRNKRLYNVISVLIFSSIFLIEKKISGVPVTVLLFFFYFFINRFFSNNLPSSSANLISKIKGLILILLGLSIFTYIINYGNEVTVVQNYFYNTGTKPAFLYLKVAANGIVFLSLAYFSFSFGSYINGDLKLINKIIRLIINLLFLLALVNIYTWMTSTSGVLGRYNFKPILISSYGINIQWCILGFMLLLSKVENFSLLSFKTIKLVIFFVSILIIMSRLNQLLFLVCLFLYFNYNARYVAKLKSIFYFLILATFTSFLIPVYNSFIFLNSYKLLSNFENDDFQVRLSTIYSALDIFSQYILMGVGYGMFAGYNKATFIVERTEVNLGSIHNGLITILVETGLTGLLIHTLIIFYICRGAFKLINYKNYTGNYKFTISIKVFIILNIVLLFVSNYTFFPPPSEYSYVGISSVSWMLIGMLLSFKEVKN